MAHGIAAATVGEFIAEHGRRAALRAHEPLFFEGDRSVSVYACVEGSVRLFVTAHGGREVVLGFKGAGEHFGELSAITGRPRASTAVAVVDAVVAHLPGERFLEQLEHVPLLAMAAIRGLADQLREANSRILARSSETVTSRTGHKLAELASLRGRHGPDVSSSDRLRLDINQHDLADWIGASREAVSRALAEFRRAGVVDTGRGHVDVIDVNALRSIADAS